MEVQSAADKGSTRYQRILAKGHPLRFDAHVGDKCAPAPGALWHKDIQELKNRVKASANLTAILSMLVTGYLPNGINWDHGDGSPPRLPLCPGSARSPGLRGFPTQYIMCCGHVLSIKKAQELVTTGLLDEGPLDRHQRPTLVITDAGREWLKLNWRDVDC